MARPDRLTRPPASLPTRLVAATVAFGLACVVAPIPTVATLMLTDPSFMGTAASTIWGPSALRALAVLPILAFFTGVFSGPFALPTLLAMAARDARGVAAHVLLGALVTLPAMLLFAASIPGELSPAIAGAIVGGGALGGIAASSVRDTFENAWIAWTTGGAHLPPAVPMLSNLRRHG